MCLDDAHGSRQNISQCAVNGPLWLQMNREHTVTVVNQPWQVWSLFKSNQVYQLANRLKDLYTSPDAVGQKICDLHQAQNQLLHVHKTNIKSIMPALRQIGSAINTRNVG